MMIACTWIACGGDFADTSAGGGGGENGDATTSGSSGAGSVANGGDGGARVIATANVSPTPGAPPHDAAANVSPTPDAATVGATDGQATTVDAGGFEVSVPSIACSPGAADASADAGGCGFPASQCVDPVTLAYFTNPACVNGLCHWDANLTRCSAGCTYGRCNYANTTAQ
jgi:hypothetical protein